MNGGDRFEPIPRAKPFRQFILKIHSRCNLACDYCYVYTMADQRWRTRPRVMSLETIDRVAARIAEHTHAYQLPSVDVILHGGEPLLAGPARIEYCVTRIREAAGQDVAVRVSTQTNGTLLDRSYLELLRSLDIRISLSVDGVADAHDRHRRDRSGAGTHAAVTRAIAELNQERYRPIYSGLLCTVNLRNDPVETYEGLLLLRPPAIDFLLPHGNWSAPPPGRDPASAATPYGDWLLRAFDRWYGARRHETRVRLFEEILNLLLGGESTVEGVGLSPTAMVVVETDGAIEQSDLLASAYHAAAATDLHVATDPFETALALPGIVARQRGAEALSTACRNCPIHRVCGGGLYPHRYRHGSGFANPSVYCPDLFRLITHVRARLSRDVAALRTSVA